ncbi:MAG: Fic family protein [Synergistaceae bacterium]|nr:Fic family protein [Synergistaceae bacterium]
MENKVSIRFFDDREIRAVWDEESGCWLFSVLDIVALLRNENDYEKTRNYWKYLKAKLRREGNELGSVTTQLKLPAPDGKRRMSNVMSYEQIIALAREFPSKNANRFIEWFARGDETVDGRSKSRAYALWGSSFMDSVEVGTVKGLRQIHGYLFGGLYDFAGQLRSKNIAKGGFQFAMARYLDQTLLDVERMPDDDIDQIISKYIEMNVAHPFMEGNGRSMRIWLDMLLKKRLNLCVDWSRVDKKKYLDAMTRSVVDGSDIKELLKAALTDKTDDRELFLKGIDYSYYYEED